MRKYVIIYGSLSDGIIGCVGLFDTEKDAERYADTFNLGHHEKIPMQVEEKDSRFE